VRDVGNDSFEIFLVLLFININKYLLSILSSYRFIFMIRIFSYSYNSYGKSFSQFFYQSEHHLNGQSVLTKTRIILLFVCDSVVSLFSERCIYTYYLTLHGFVCLTDFLCRRVPIYFSVFFLVKQLPGTMLGLCSSRDGVNIISTGGTSN